LLLSMLVLMLVCWCWCAADNRQANLDATEQKKRSAGGTTLNDVPAGSDGGLYLARMTCGC
jgi:hypothetical protein